MKQAGFTDSRLWVEQLVSELHAYFELHQSGVITFDELMQFTNAVRSRMGLPAITELFKPPRAGAP